MPSKRSENKILLLLLGFLLLGLPPAALGQEKGETPDTTRSAEIENEPVQDEALTLAACVRIALDRNPIQRAALEGIRAAEENVGLAKAPFYPHMDFTAGYRRFDRHVFLPSGVSALAQADTLGGTDDWHTSLASRYTLYDSGERRAELEAALARKGISVEEAGRIRQDLILNVHQSYFNLLSAYAEAAARQESLDRREEHLRLVKVRARTGDVPQSDVIRARVEVSNARRQLVRAENQIRTARAELNAAMGLPVILSIEISPESIPPGLQPEEVELAEAIEEALDQRPDLKKARLELLAARKNVDAVKGSYGAKLRAEAQYGLRDEEFGPEDEEWAAGVALEIPIFTGFARQHEVSRARAEQAQNDAELDSLQLSVQEEVAKAYSRLIETYQEIETTDLLKTDAQESLRLIQRRYEVGAATINDLLDVEASLTEAESDHVDAIYNHHQATSRFKRALGKLDSSSQVSSLPLESRRELPYAGRQ
jgi:outer membrane protein